MPDNRNFFVGGYNFEKIIKWNRYYVDKTHYLKKLFIDDGSTQAHLFIRPRRFGKTLNMNMIEHFCDLNYQNPGDKSYQEEIFLDNGRNLSVACDDCKELRDKFMGEFPVISISFKDVGGYSYIGALTKLLEAYVHIYEKFEFFKDSDKISSISRDEFIREYSFCKNKAKNLEHSGLLSFAESIARNFISDLARMLYKEYGRKVIILIDEYDVPLQRSVSAKEPYYDKMLELLRDIMSLTFKPDSDEWLYSGILVGCLKIAHQSIFTGANNFVFNDISDNGYATFFGFTRNEVKKILDDYELSDQEEAVKEWYDGYRIGNEHLYYPWSIINFCCTARTNMSNIKAQPFWINTSGNDAVNSYIRRVVNGDLYRDIPRLEDLLDNKPLQIELQEFEVYPTILDKDVCFDFDRFMTMLLHTGYLTFTDDSPLQKSVFLKIPNNEIRNYFVKEIKRLYDFTNPVWFENARKLLDHLLANETDDARSILNFMLGKYISVRSTEQDYYHGLMHTTLGIAAMQNNLTVTSERESKDGYYDMIIDDVNSHIAVILEFKECENNPKSRLDTAKKASEQIVERNYAQEFIECGYPKIYGLGIGFGGKRCEFYPLGNLAEG